MAQVTGLGGIFYKVEDPERTARWYKETLGVGGDWGAMFPWKQDASGEAYSLLSPFKAASDYFAPSDARFMINLRVDDLDGLKASLTAAGIEVITKPEWDTMPEVGQFARIHDPEGNAIELWQPAPPA